MKTSEYTRTMGTYTLEEATEDVTFVLERLHVRLHALENGGTSTTPSESETHLLLAAAHLQASLAHINLSSLSRSVVG